jgi:hypothetical protein
MQLTFLGKETTGGQSPTLYATDRDSYVVQGWVVTEDNILERLDQADEETVVEVPARLLVHLEKDGVRGQVTSLEPPIMFVKDNGNYIIQGERVDDAEALSTMDIPGHETCVEVPKAHLRALIEGQ